MADGQRDDNGDYGHRAKRLAEDVADDVFGVSDVHNELKVRRGGRRAGVTGEDATEHDDIQR